MATLVLGAVLAARVTSTSFSIPSGSMAPTLLIKDHVYVRLRHGALPARGEVIAFDLPDKRAERAMKRVIALPGETFETIDGRPVLNGWIAPHCDVGPFPLGGKTFELFLEFLGDRAYGTLFDQKPDGAACSTDADCRPGFRCGGATCGVLQGPFRVEAGEVWVLGDNRDNSYDSPKWFDGRGGGLSVRDVIGPALFVLGEGDGRSLASAQGAPALLAEHEGLRPKLEKCLRERPSVAEASPPRAP